MRPPHGFGNALTCVCPQHRLREHSIEPEIDIGYSGSRLEHAVVGFVIAAKGPDVVESSLLEAHQIVPANKVRGALHLILWHHHSFVHTRRQHIDEIDVACKLVVLLLCHRAGNEDAEVANGFMYGVDDGLAVRADLVLAVVKVEYPV